MKGIRLTIDIEDVEFPDDLPEYLRPAYEKFDTGDGACRADEAAAAAAGRQPDTGPSVTLRINRAAAEWAAAARAYASYGRVYRAERAGAASPTQQQPSRRRMRRGGRTPTACCAIPRASAV